MFNPLPDYLRNKKETEELDNTQITNIYKSILIHVTKDTTFGDIIKAIFQDEEGYNTLDTDDYVFCGNSEKGFARFDKEWFYSKCADKINCEMISANNMEKDEKYGVVLVEGDPDNPLTLINNINCELDYLQNHSCKIVRVDKYKMNSVYSCNEDRCVPTPAYIIHFRKRKSNGNNA